MKPKHSLRRGITLMELLIAGFIMSLIGAGIYQMIRASYDSQQRILDQNTAISRAREAIDNFADQLRGAASVTSASVTDITFVTNANESVRYWKSGARILRSINGTPSTGEIVVRGVSFLSFSYWVWTGSSWAASTAPTDVTKIGGLRIRAAVLMGQSSRSIVSDVKIRQRRLTPNP